MTQRARYQGMGVQTAKYKWQPYSILANKFDVRMKERENERSEMNRSISPGIWQRNSTRAKRETSVSSNNYRIAGMNTYRR